mgnify:CR=1 FL=1
MDNDSIKYINPFLPIDDIHNLVKVVYDSECFKEYKFTKHFLLKEVYS